MEVDPFLCSRAAKPAAEAAGGKDEEKLGRSQLDTPGRTQLSSGSRSWGSSY